MCAKKILMEMGWIVREKAGSAEGRLQAGGSVGEREETAWIIII